MAVSRDRSGFSVETGHGRGQRPAAAGRDDAVSSGRARYTTPRLQESTVAMVNMPKTLRNLTMWKL